MSDPLKIYWSYSNKRYFVSMGGEQVFVTQDEYTRDMFIAELKARIIIMRQEQVEEEQE